MMQCQFHLPANKSDDERSTRNQVENFKYGQTPIQLPPPIRWPVIKVPKVVFQYNAANTGWCLGNGRRVGWIVWCYHEGEYKLIWRIFVLWDWYNETLQLNVKSQLHLCYSPLSRKNA